MSRLVVLCAWILATSATAGVIEGSRRVGVDKSAILRVPLSASGTSYSWQVAGNVAWISGENKTETFVILLDLAAGSHVVSFVSFDQQLHELAIVEAGTPPGPTPPTPNPPGPLPDGRFRLANSAAIWVTTLVPTPARRKASGIAANFAAKASAIGAGTLTDPAKILAETRAGNNAALGDAASIEAWKPFGTALEKELKRLHDAGELRVAVDYRDAWLEIAQGVESAR